MRGIVRLRSEAILAACLMGMLLPVRLVPAQQGPTPDPACACYVKENPGTPDNPGPDTPPPGPDRKWLVVGAAGLAVLSGIPFGGTTVQGLPFAAAPAAPDLPAPVVEVAEAPQTPTAEAPPPAGAPAPVGVAPAPKPVVPLPEVERAGVVPPKTATHLPLLAAAGVLMLGGGTLLARKGARERRRRRRFVTL